MEFKFTTDDVSKLDKSNDFNDEQKPNIEAVLLAFEVLYKKKKN